MSILRATMTVVRKDLRIELRTGEIVVTTSMFAMLVAVLTSLSFYVDSRNAPLVAPGVLWIAVAFSGVLAMGRSWGRERDNDAIRALMAAPIPRTAIYLGKAIATLLFLSVVETLLILTVAVLFNLNLAALFAPLALLLFLGTVGFVAAGTLFAAMGVRTRSRDMILAVALFPIIAPALLCGVVATRELFGGASMDEIRDWLTILAAFDIAFVTAGTMLFEPLMQD